MIDDMPSMQRLLAGILEDLGCDAEAFTRADEFLDRFDERLNCVVLDLHLPDRSGLEILGELSARQARVPVVFMSGHASAMQAVSSLKLGSVDFLEKPFSTERVKAVLTDALAVDSRRRADLRRWQSLQDRFALLTQRELEVLHRITRGAANKQVARELHLSQKTVEAHRARVMRKSEAGSLAELVQMYFAAGLGGPPADGSGRATPSPSPVAGGGLLPRQ